MAYLQKGYYDFGKQNKNEVKLAHETNYLDVFFMVDDQPKSLLNDFYQLTGNPVLLPKFGFMKDILMPTTEIIGRKTIKEYHLKTEKDIKRAKRQWRS